MENQSRSLHPSCDHGEFGILKIPLSGLATGKIGVVSHLDGGKEFTTRVACLGFTIGAQVTVLQNYGQGPMIVSMLGAHIALGRQEAGLILVQPL
jgi:Fe2+ transport system protein FeoA